MTFMFPPSATGSSGVATTPRYQRFGAQFKVEIVSGSGAVAAG
jgi:hypothetical protein